jgi:hypothetical protein
MRLVHWINLLLLAAVVGGSVWAWPHLPARIPAHLGADGEVTRWTGRTAWSWFLLPLVTLATVALNYGIAALLPGRPHLMNLPDRKRFLALPPERRAPVIARMQDFLYGFSAPLIVLMGAIQWTMYRAAVGTDGAADVLVVLLASFLLTPLVLAVWLPRIQGELRRQVREHAAATDGARGV